MIISNTDKKSLKLALKQVSSMYDNNIIFDRLDCTNKKKSRFVVRLKCKDSRHAGHKHGTRYVSENGELPRILPGGRHLISCCWHVFGHFFEKLLEISPDARIQTSWGSNRIITKNGGNWEDCNRGNSFTPVWESQLCHCEN